MKISLGLALLILSACASTPHNSESSAENRPSFIARVGHVLQNVISGMGRGGLEGPRVVQMPHPVTCTTSGMNGLYTTNCY